MKLSLIAEMKEFMPTRCDFRFGDCSIETYKVVKNAIINGVSNFIVVDGMVMVDDKEYPHTWIEKNGEIFDPTVSQFEGKNIIYSPPESYRDEFRPVEYVRNMEEDYGNIMDFDKI